MFLQWTFLLIIIFSHQSLESVKSFLVSVSNDDGEGEDNGDVESGQNKDTASEEQNEIKDGEGHTDDYKNSEANRTQYNCIDYTKELGIGGMIIQEPSKRIFRGKMPKPQCIERCKRMPVCFYYVWNRVTRGCRLYPRFTKYCRKYNNVEYGSCIEGPPLTEETKKNTF